MEKFVLGNVVRLFSYVFKGVDEELFNHGKRVAYILLNYLIEENTYSKDEISQMIQIAILHDIGACKLEESIKLRENKELFINHYVYGYVFLEYYSLYGKEMSEICLYHHFPDEKYDSIKSKYKEIARLFNALNEVDKICKEGSIEASRNFCESIHRKNNSDSFEILYKIIKRNNICEKLINGEYKKELYDYLDSIILSKEEVEQFVKMIVHCNNFRSIGTLNHSITVEVITYYLYKFLDVEPENINTILLAAFCHDIGKISIPVEILEKPAKLTFEEMEVMKKHVVYSGEILRWIGLEDVAKLAELHHEKIDGTGYPFGLKGNEISLDARILAVADILSALMEKRAYKEEFSKDRTVDILKSMAEDNKIDKDIVNVVIKNYDLLVEISEKVRRKNNFRQDEIIRKCKELTEYYDELIS